MKRAFIVTGGSVLATFGSNYLSGYSFDLKIAVDSGIHFFYETGIRPDQIVGDFDSADKNELRFFESISCALSPKKTKQIRRPPCAWPFRQAVHKSTY